MASKAVMDGETIVLKSILSILLSKNDIGVPITDAFVQSLYRCVFLTVYVMQK